MFRTPHRAVAALCVSFVTTTPVAALTVADVMRRHHDRIELCEQAIPEIARQADRHAHHLETWIAHRRSWLEEMDRNVQRLSEEHERARTFADRAVAVAPSLQGVGQDRSFVPHIGWGVFGFFEQHRDRTNAAIAEAMGTVQDGSFRFHVSTAGGGWMTRTNLEDRIALEERAVQALRASVDAGTYRIHHPALGWVSRTSLDDCIAREGETMAEVMAVINAGEYRVHLPGLEWVTRNSLQARIDALRVEINELDRQLSAGTVRIHRGPREWFDRPTLDRWLDANQVARQEAEARAARGEFAHNLPLIGGTTAERLGALIAERRAAIAQLRQQAAAGDYGVPGPAATFTANRAREMLARPNCRPQGPTPCLEPTIRNQLEDVLRRIPIALAFDIEVRQLEIQRLETWRNALAEHLAPEINRLETDRGLLTMLAGEFAEEIREMREHLERQVRYLTDSLDLLP